MGTLPIHFNAMHLHRQYTRMTKYNVTLYRLIGTHVHCIYMYM